MSTEVPSFRAACSKCNHAGPTLPADLWSMVAPYAKPVVGLDGDTSASVPFEDLIEELVQATEWHYQMYEELKREYTSLSVLLDEQSNATTQALDLSSRALSASRTGDARVATGDSTCFHLPDCKWAEFFVGTRTCLWYQSRFEAVAAGKKPCKTCCS